MAPNRLSPTSGEIIGFIERRAGQAAVRGGDTGQARRLVVAEDSKFFRSQWGQDRFIYEYLMSFRHGTYFEVGADDGETLSNTFYFDRVLDWRGILVEMQPQFAEIIREKRPRANVFSGALGAEATKLLYFDAGDRSGLLRYGSGFEYLEKFHQNTEPKPEYRVHWVDVLPLMDVVAEAGLSHIDYFSLDVEGGEMAVLRAIDFSKLTIDLFTIEDNLTQWAEHRAYLELKGYQWIGALGVDALFLHERFVDQIAN